MGILNSIEKRKVESYLIENECANSVVWESDDDYCTTLDAEGNVIECFMIDIDETGICYTPISNWQTTICIE